MARGPCIGVVLAGGASSRMGRPKALLDDGGGRTFLERLVRTLLRGGCDAVLVVAGRHVKEISASLPAGALLVHNSAWRDGQLSSARCGVEAALRLQASCVLLHPVDQPLITAKDVAATLEAAKRSGLAVATHRGAPGHPLALSARIAKRLLADGASETLRDAVQKLGTPRAAKASAGAIRGANTREELDALLRGQRMVKFATTGK